MTGTYDPVTNQLFWPTGNPSPSNRGQDRAGDNLYSNTLLALDADTGELNWYFQFTRHDEHDWDATQVPIMIDQGAKHLIARLRGPADCRLSDGDHAVFVSRRWRSIS
jgi:glucose dehydrogenase